MLSRRHRLGTEGLKVVMAKGKRLYGAFFSASYLPSTYETRIAVIISKKVVRGSVGRHRLKRIIMALIEAHPLPLGAYAFFITKKAVDMSPEEMEAAYCATILA